MKRLAFIAVAGLLVTISNAGTLYTSDFAGGITSGFSAYGTFDSIVYTPNLYTSPSGTEFLLLDNVSTGDQEAANLILSGVARGEITVTFDLYA